MSNTNPLVSVIIPVYKVEKYLKQCVDSVRNQTYTNLEIILVDDGSPDRCGEICDEYAAEDSRVRVIHQSNQGVAKARNTGIDLAKGDYFFFVDSDDVVERNALDTFMETVNLYTADMVCSGCSYIDEEGYPLDRSTEERMLIMNTDEALRYYAPREWAPWNRLVKAEVHKGIYFPPYKIHEDEAIKFRLIEQCKTVVEIPAATYQYRQRASSITAQNSNTDRMDMFYSRRDNYNYLVEHHPEIVDYFLRNICDAALYNLGVLINQNDTPSKSGRIKEVVQFIGQNYKTIKKSKQLPAALKIRCSIIVCSNWKKEKCLYVRFYKLLDKLRGRN